jgi:hypothetical protein
MRRLTALLLFVFGYLAIAALDASVAAGPALVAFSLGGWALVRPALDGAGQRA